jgi:hypothetical protein
MVEKANHIWRRDNIQMLLEGRDRFDSPEAMRRYIDSEIACDHEMDQRVAAAFPRGMSEMLRALFQYNLSEEGPHIAIQFAWMPGYDWELTIAEAPGTPDSPGAFSVIVRGRYPRDPHPSTIR